MSVDDRLEPDEFRYSGSRLSWPPFGATDWIDLPFEYGRIQSVEAVSGWPASDDVLVRTTGAVFRLSTQGHGRNANHWCVWIVEKL